LAISGVEAGEKVIDNMAARLDFGCVWINTHIPLVAEMPHGGVEHSGYGKDLSRYGLEDYTRVTHVMRYHGFEG
jgi:betaine-aldehyde dehydrogenase